jgi:hypothetical protein
MCSRVSPRTNLCAKSSGVEILAASRLLMFGTPDRFIYSALSSSLHWRRQSGLDAFSRSHFTRTWISPVEAFAVNWVAKPVDLAPSSVVDSKRWMQSSDSGIISHTYSNVVLKARLSCDPASTNTLASVRYDPSYSLMPKASALCFYSFRCYKEPHVGVRRGMHTVREADWSKALSAARPQSRSKPKGPTEVGHL